MDEAWEEFIDNALAGVEPRAENRAVLRKLLAADGTTGVLYSAWGEGGDEANLRAIIRRAARELM